MVRRQVRAQRFRNECQAACLSQAHGEAPEYGRVQVHHLLGKDRGGNAADGRVQVKKLDFLPFPWDRAGRSQTQWLADVSQPERGTVMYKPKTLVTGATGKTGSAVVSELLAKGWSVS